MIVTVTAPGSQPAVRTSQPTSNGEVVRTQIPGTVGPSGAPRFQTLTPNNGVLSIDTTVGNYVKAQLSEPTAIVVTKWAAAPEMGRLTLELDLVSNGSISSWPANSIFGYHQTIGTSVPPAKDVFLLTTVDDGATIFVNIVGLNYGPSP